MKRNQNLINHVLKNFFRDKTGKVVVGQFPNVPLVLWAVLLFLSKIPQLGYWSDGLSNLSLGFLMIWSYLELSSGVNYFRRMLGGIGLLYACAKFLGCL